MSTPLERRIAQHMPAIMELVAHMWGEDQDGARSTAEAIVRQIAAVRPLTDPGGERKKRAAVEKKIRELRRDIAELNVQVWPNPHQALMDELAKKREIEMYAGSRSARQTRLRLAADLAYNLLDTDAGLMLRATSGTASPTHQGSLYRSGPYVQLTRLLYVAATGDNKVNIDTPLRACKAHLDFMRQFQ